MKTKRALSLLVASVALLSFISLAFGSQFISPFALFQPTTDAFATLFSFRLPRIFIAIFAGGLLSSSGFILQTTLKNNLASPDIIGLGKGSSLAIVICNFFIPYPSKTALLIASLIGALLASIILFHVAKRFRFSTKTIILTGIALAFFFDATTKLFTLSQKQLLMKQLTWLVGSLWGRYWEMVPLLILTSVVFFFIFFLTRDQFFLLQFESSVISSLGKNAASLTWFYILLSTMATGVAISSVGAIGFIGLIGPHIVKKFIPIYTHWRFVFIFLTGSIILLFADLVGRSFLSPLEIPAGIIVALIGSPYFLFILLKQRTNGGG